MFLDELKLKNTNIQEKNFWFVNTRTKILLLSFDQNQYHFAVQIEIKGIFNDVNLHVHRMN